MRITKDPDTRRKEIIDSAMELFKSKGINKVSISEIARSIGVAKGLVYYYFSSKDELIDSVVNEFIKDVDDQLKSIIEKNSDFYQSLKEILNLYFNSIQQHPLIQSYSSGQPEIFSIIRDRLSAIALSHAKDLLARGIKLGIINIQYPEYMLKIIITGLGDLYVEGVTDPVIHAALIEQMLHLEKGVLSGDLE